MSNRERQRAVIDDWLNDLFNYDGHIDEYHEFSNGVIAESVVITMRDLINGIQQRGSYDSFGSDDAAAFDMAIFESLQAYEMERKPVVLNIAPLTWSVDAEACQCSICMEPVEAGDECITLTCSHVYHAGCIREWACHRTSCPVCRTDIPTGPVETGVEASVEAGND
jgi:hypothetical protein